LTASMYKVHVGIESAYDIPSYHQSSIISKGDWHSSIKLY
jgi:hypothetical protein